MYRPILNHKFYLPVFAAMLAAPAWAADIPVPVGGDIQAAVDGAQDGDTIVLAAGEYTLGATLILGDRTEPYTPKKLTLKGAGKGVTIIKGAGDVPGFAQSGQYPPETPLIELQWRPTHNNAIPAAGGVSENSGTSIQDLTLAGWEESGAGDGYLLWAGGVQDVHIKNVEFRSNNNRVAIYSENGDGLKVEDSSFKGTFYRWAYRGSGQRVQFTNNTFDVTNPENGGILLFEYGKGTDALIKGNLFRHTVAGPSYASTAGSHYTIRSLNPLNPSQGAQAIKIEDNHFQFVVLGKNSSGKYPVPAAINLQRSGYTLSQNPGAPTFITGNTFVGYDYLGNDVVNPPIITTHINSTVTGNAFAPHSKSSVILTGTGSPALDATNNFWGKPTGPSVSDTTGDVDTGSFVTSVPASITGPVSIVGKSGTYLSITEAIAAAEANDTISVSPGVYQEAVLLNKNGLKLLSAAGNEVTKIIPSSTKDGSGGTIQIPAGVNGIQIGDEDHGFEIVGYDSSFPGQEAAAIYLVQQHDDIKIIDNVIVAAGDSALMTEYGFPVTNLTVTDNTFTGQTFQGPVSGGPSGNQFDTANWPRALVYLNHPGTSTLEGELSQNIVLARNVFSGISGDSNNSNLLVAIDANGTTIDDNTFSGTVGGTFQPLLRVRGKNHTITDNTFSGTAPGALIVGGTGSTWAPFNTAGTTTLKDNSLVGNFAGYFVQNATADHQLDASKNYWNSEHGPVLNLAKLVGDIKFSPWWTTAAMDTLRATAQDDNVDSTEIEGDETFEEFYVAPGQTVTVPPDSSLTMTDLEIGEGGQLVVEGGEITIGDGNGSSTVSGSFIVFNSFGSVVILDDTTFTSTGLGLAWISDVHVKAGTEITVAGLLSWDGCVIDSAIGGEAPGVFNLTVANGGRLALARSDVSDAAISVEDGGEARIYDNQLRSGTSIVALAGSDTRAYHNILSGATIGAGVTQIVDGWGNVNSLAETQNRLSLEFEVPSAPNRTRKLDPTTGLYDLYVQSNDEVVVGLNVSQLGVNTIDTVDMKLGYLTSLLSFDTHEFAPGSPWQNVAVDDDKVAFGAVGLIDAGNGYAFSSIAPPSAADDQVTRLKFQATASPVNAVTSVFFRPDIYDADISQTWFDKLAASNRIYRPGFSAQPFTTNTGRLIIDNTPPALVGVATASQEQLSVAGAVNVFDAIEVAVREPAPVVVVFQTSDNLAGIDDEDVTVTASNGTTSLSFSRAATDTDVDDNHTFELVIPTSATSGQYTVGVQVIDRSGNVTTETLGTFTLTDEVLAEVELDGFNGSTRDVTFVATNSAGQQVGIWPNTPVSFTTVGSAGKIGKVTLTEVPAGTARISAKTNWTLRKRTAVNLTDGYGTISLTAAAGNATPGDLNDGYLPAGDFNGDNVINGADYTLLRSEYLSLNPWADITGDGVTNASDYTVFAANYFAVGSPE